MSLPAGINIELVNTGSELMFGRMLNTHQQWLCRKLTELGYAVRRQAAVADSAPDIECAIREALSRADGVIVTGGLGPTSDDFTRDVVARMLGKTLREDPDVLEHVRSFFSQRKRPMPESTRIQALVPEGALVFPNANGTAPGLALDVQPNLFRSDGRQVWLILLPGPPRELRPMFVESVVPLLQRVLPLNEPLVIRTLNTVGIGESVVQEAIEGPLRAILGAGLQLGYCARPGHVEVRLSAHGADAMALVQEAETVVRGQLGSSVFGIEDETLEEVVIRLLSARHETLSLAESCTGGCIAHRLTNIPGASAVFLSGAVTYSNEAKERFLGVQAETLARHGAVSEAVAREMADGARCRNGSDYAIAVTGIAGPAGGTEEKPVGTVYIALASPRGTEVWKKFNCWDRATFKDVTASQALNQLRLHLESL